jgi:hypothetical protein
VKAISIQQPWAWAILHAGKNIENRSWSTAHRGDVAVHATRLQSDWELPDGVTPPRKDELTLRSIIGVVEIVDVVTRSRSPWFTGPYGFELRNPRVLSKPVRCPGNLRLWTVPPRIEKAVTAGLAAAPSIKRKPERDGRAALASRCLTVTQGNVNNNHLYLTDALDLFPPDVLGGPGRAQAARTVRVEWNDESVETDIVRARNIFRSRGWIGKFFAVNGIAAGDQVLLEKIGPYRFRVSKVEG